MTKQPTMMGNEMFVARHGTLISFFFLGLLSLTILKQPSLFSF
jgi:hypothetical protein